jgi:outer membrane protein assembly factor BamD (BamD/ComL family)
MSGRLLMVAMVAVGAGGATLCAQVSESRLGADGRWVATPPPEVPAEATDLVEARRLLASGDHAAARRLLDPWIETYRRTDNPHLAEAYLLRGDARLAAGNEWKALYDYEALIRQFPGSPEFVTALERELEVGLKYTAGLKRKQLGVRWVGARSEGAELLIRIQERLPGSRLAERAAIELADYYYRRGELELAATSYDILLKNFPRSQYRRRAMLRLVFAQIARYEGPPYDAAGLVEARELVEDFRSSYPADAGQAGLNSELVGRIDEQLGAQLLEKARFYDRRRDPVSSRLVLRRLVDRHPGTDAARKALALLNERGWMSAPAPASSPELTLKNGAEGSGVPEKRTP